MTRAPAIRLPVWSLFAVVGLSALVTATAAAAPPEVKGVSPLGVQKGVAAELTFSGGNLAGHPRLIAPFGFSPASPEPAGSDASNWKTRLTVEPGTPVGVYPVRVQTDEGLSNPFLVAVGQLPQVAEKEDNSTFEAAQEFTAPAVVEGQASGNDVDYFRFRGRKGQRIVIDAQCARIGSGVDPSIRLTTAGRAFIASADDSPGLLTDARLFAVLPDDGDYVIELSDSRYQGGGRPVYRLLVGEVPAAEEVYPIGGRRGETVGLELRGGTVEGVAVAASTLAPAAGLTTTTVRVVSGAMAGSGGEAREVESLGPLLVSELPELREPADPAAPPLRAAAPVALNGRIDPAGDEDRFTLAVAPGQRLRVEVEAAESGSALDGVLQVLDAKGNVQATADDQNTRLNPGKNPPQVVVSPDPSLDYTVPTGATEVTLALKDLQSRGGIGFPYRITVTTVTPDFELALNDAQVSVPKGGAAAVGVTVVRKGYNGPITLKVANPPAGLTVRPGTIAAGQTVGAFTVSAEADASFAAAVLDVVGEGQAEGSAGAIVRQASKALVFAQQGILPTNSVTQVGLAAVPAPTAAVGLDAPSAPVEVAHGLGVPVTVKATRPEGATGALALSALPLPPGLTVASAKIDEKATEAAVNVATTTDHPVGKVTVVLLAKGKVAGADRTLAVPAVTLDVVRPASVELAAPGVEIKSGSAAEVKGKVVRRGGFKEPVALKVNGLPAGVKAEPVTVAADASEFTLKLSADEKAAAGSATANVATAFQVNKKDYPAQTAAVAVKVLPAK
jgi:hypothetical protein